MKEDSPLQPHGCIQVDVDETDKDREEKAISNWKTQEK